MSENNLVVKNVEFNGANLRAAQDIDGQIYAGVKWMCDGIGLSENKIKNERLKIQKDMVLSQGKKFLPLGIGNSDTEVLCLKLDYVPLWLAKISITPTMKKETPEVVENLISYQLKAKDVLADAFLNKKYKNMSNANANVNSRILQVELPDQPDYSQDFTNLKDEMAAIREENAYLRKGINCIYKNMGTLSQFLIDWKNSNGNSDSFITNASVVNTVIKNTPTASQKKKVNYSYGDMELFGWKKKQYSLMDKILKERKSILTNKNAILKYVYDYMRSNYGICWEQEVKDYKEKYYLDKKPYTIDVVYDNEQYRSIFSSVLNDMYHQNMNHNKVNNNSLKKKNNKNSSSNDLGNVDAYTKRTAKLNDSVALLADKYNDTSVYKMNSWQMMYKELTNAYNVNWDNLTTQFIQTSGKRPVTKKEIIVRNAVLYGKAIKCIGTLILKAA